MESPGEEQPAEEHSRDAPAASPDELWRLPGWEEGERPEATPEEFKAMAHPLRLRILRLCAHQGLTNKEIADRLEMDPATTLHHVRMLLRSGFLAAEDVRTGNRGALEKPYRATGKSWVLSVPRSEDQDILHLAAHDAVRGELAESGPEDRLAGARMGLRMSAATADELRERIEGLVRELNERHGPRNRDAEGDAYGFYVTFHRTR